MYVCGNYAKQPVGTLCKSEHRIKADHVMEIVAKTIKEVIQYASLDKGRFAEEIQSHIEDGQTVEAGGNVKYKFWYLQYPTVLKLYVVMSDA